MTKKIVGGEPALKTKRFKKDLLVKLTAEEWEAAATKHAIRTREIGELEAKKKLLAKDFTDRILIAKREAEKLSKAVETHEEERETNCESKYDFEKNRVHTIRLDTGATIDERAMSPDERNKMAQDDLAEAQ